MILTQKRLFKFLKKNNINYIFSFSSNSFLKKKIINLFKNKIINLHPSILPEREVQERLQIEF